ncbi:hypothetical protein [Nodularia sphaerocarpa]|uniref:hypothetical protein n=1 Tax=Nodularia sphaerocarpa TaxID=137816 RepID=UPI001EFB8468|nr:hypothetical protein [Nodularia sphaerocarpa]MDB9375385.1 hypothetical protein [Nodularia sphaerocarpa CS-585]MDB9380244.1 hypothetical protein [Nodularia sphaerocarpa CS-585A2]ULP70804.1 hypothetical protein BDGGKGIB_00423 [Nodularia sphaerocarpa UHCC 0038]
MNAGNYKLVKSYNQLKLQPEGNLKFANLLSNQSINAAFNLLEIALFHNVKDAKLSQQVKYLQKKLLSIALENVNLGFFLHYWLKRWRNMLTPDHMSRLRLPGYFRFKFGDRHRTQKTESLCWKLPLPT